MISIRMCFEVYDLDEIFYLDGLRWTINIFSSDWIQIVFLLVNDIGILNRSISATCNYAAYIPIISRCIIFVTKRRIIILVLYRSGSALNLVCPNY